jgi:DNA-directed RNA polymerase specialized sigma24 family protein
LLSLRFDEGLSFSEIGETLDRPASTVKSQYARLISRLKTLLTASTKELDRHV